MDKINLEPHVRSIEVTIDAYGRIQSSVPKDFREALGIDRIGARMRMVLVKNGILIIPCED